VVLLNLGLGWAPSWHYAVAVGYDLDARIMLLRSGPMRRQEMPLDTFEHTWARSERWAFVVLAPGRLPAAAGEAAVTQGLIAFARVAPPAAARRSYEAAVRRWPGNLALLTGLGNAAVGSGDLPAALAAFEAGVRAHPDVSAAHNNLAAALMELGRLDEARISARRAIELGGEWADIARQTLAEIDQRAGAAAPGRSQRRP
jgi:tetratricopeptide (TPR) repeat protein